MRLILSLDISPSRMAARPKELTDVKHNNLHSCWVFHDLLWSVALYMFISKLHRVRHVVLTSYCQGDGDRQREMTTRVILPLSFPSVVDYMLLLLNILRFIHIGNRDNKVQLVDMTRSSCFLHILKRWLLYDYRFCEIECQLEITCLGCA